MSATSYNSQQHHEYTLVYSCLQAVYEPTQVKDEEISKQKEMLSKTDTSMH